MVKFKYQDALKKIAVAAVEAIEAVIKFKDAKSVAERLTAFGALGDDILNLVTLEWQGAREEWRNRTPELVASLAAACREEFDIPDDELEVKIEDSVEAAFHIFQEVADMKDRWCMSCIVHPKAV